MGDSSLSIYKTRRVIANILAATRSVFVLLDDLERVIGYDSTYKRYHRIMRQLDSQGELIQRSRSRYELTNKGVVKLLPMIKPKLVKDGKLRILVFDVPEERRTARNRFRRCIKMLGFQMHQRSVWVSRHDCEKWLGKVVEYYKLQDCVSLYMGKQVI